MKLIMIPFGGGNKFSYNYLKKYLAQDIKMIAVELPGRGYRMNEELLYNASDLVGDIYNKLKTEMEPPYAIYGHCMGGLIGYLFARKVYEEDGFLPNQLLVSGCPGPSYYHSLGKVEISDNEIRDMLLDFGTSNQLLENEEFFEMISPMVRADFKVLNEYRHQQLDPILIPITIVIEPGSRFSMEELSLWRLETELDVDFHSLSAKIHESAKSFAALVNSRLFSRYKSKNESQIS